MTVRILHAKYQLIYTLGSPTALDGGALRWRVAAAVLASVARHARKLAEEFGPKALLPVPTTAAHQFPESLRFCDASLLESFLITQNLQILLVTSCHLGLASCACKASLATQNHKTLEVCNLIKSTMLLCSIFPDQVCSLGQLRCSQDWAAAATSNSAAVCWRISSHKLQVFNCTCVLQSSSTSRNAH